MHASRLATQELGVENGIMKGKGKTPATQIQFNERNFQKDTVDGQAIHKNR